MDDETRRLIEADLAAVRPFSEIAARHDVGLVDVALVHNRMQPQPPGWPEQIPAALWEEVAEALRRDDLARIAAGGADPLLRTVYELDAEERRMTPLDAEVLRLWLGGETASLLLRHARRLGSSLADESSLERMAEAKGIDWRTVRGAAIQERNHRDLMLAATLTDDELVDHALENHGLPPADIVALEAAARSDP